MNRLFRKKYISVWFGRGKKSALIKKCIKSWKQQCPDYEIIEWNEDNFDINSTIWTKQAYECKKWAFVSDYVRLWVLYNYGGIYIDTDVELLKSIDRFLIHNAFSGMENHRIVPTGIIGSIQKQEMIKEFLDWYDNRTFVNDGIQWHESNTKFITELLKKHGGLTPAIGNYYQTVKGLALYPKTYFCPRNIDDISNCKSNYTYAIHYFASSWRTKKEIRDFKKAKRRQELQHCSFPIKKAVRLMLGDNIVEDIKKKLKK